MVATSGPVGCPQPPDFAGVEVALGAEGGRGKKVVGPLAERIAQLRGERDAEAELGAFGERRWHVAAQHLP